MTMPCNCCEITDQAFGETEARDDLREYQHGGPAGQTRELLKAIRSYGLKAATLLDVGGGVGVIHHELLDDMVSEATHVDSSSAYLKEAAGEAARRRHSDRVKFVHADFSDVAAGLPKADIVTLDRVVCCYPDFRGLLIAAAGRSQRLLALSYPRETWYLRLGFAIVAFFQNMRRDRFRVFLHPVRDMEQLLNSEGLRLVSLKRLFVWEVALYTRG